MRHSLPTPSQSPSGQAAIHTGLFPGDCSAGMLTGSFSLDTGTVAAGDDKEPSQLGTALCCVLPAMLLLSWKPDFSTLSIAIFCECPIGNMAIEEQERRNKSVLDSSGSKAPRSGGVWSGH